jgi:threonine dehydratase
MSTPQAIQQAAARLAPHIRPTPSMVLQTGDLGLPYPLWLKLEQLQHAGSFKTRGAFNHILAQPQPPQAVIAASGGNHGAAVAYAAQRLGLPAEIFVPTISSAAKVARIRSYGAQVTVIGANYNEALEHCQARAQQTGALWVPAYESAEILAGQGTVALEMEAQAPQLDTVLVAVGGGGLIGGIAAWLASRVRVVAVEPETCPTLYQARLAGHPVAISPGGLAADALGARSIGDLAFEVTQQHVALSLLVSDQAIRQAQLTLWSQLQLAVEPGGAAALSALLSGAYQPAPGERVGVVVCGANLDPASLAQ